MKLQNQMPEGMQNQQMNMNPSTSQNHSAHEMMDTHEVIGSLIGMLEQYKLYEQHIQDPELKDILQRQATFTTQLYNTVISVFRTGQDPKVPTQEYQMKESNEVTYGMKPGQPKQPKQSVNELTDECYASFMLGQTKAIAGGMTTAAAEMNQPVLRRVIADSIPNMIEMSYEIFLYQNKHGYYQLPQLSTQDMAIMAQGYAPVGQQGMQH
ncbi:spore coat protein [Gracilibacillus alcaliphilus]|uniref:spore coat protein n=1 Tax=Gracilibacillus alcaliphilus TaxID=1401441 RepID=UPI00195D2978|nr:spore coat protein [Gracilibacillus alcaliphilus]